METTAPSNKENTTSHAVRETGGYTPLPQQPTKNAKKKGVIERYPTFLPVPSITTTAVADDVRTSRSKRFLEIFPIVRQSDDRSQHHIPHCWDVNREYGIAVGAPTNSNQPRAPTFSMYQRALPEDVISKPTLQLPGEDVDVEDDDEEADVSNTLAITKRRVDLEMQNEFPWDNIPLNLSNSTTSMITTVDRRPNSRPRYWDGKREDDGVIGGRSRPRVDNFAMRDQYLLDGFGRVIFESRVRIAGDGGGGKGKGEGESEKEEDNEKIEESEKEEEKAATVYPFPLWSFFSYIKRL